MHRFGAQGFRLALAMIAVCISTSSAHAYLDPGTGSILLQVLLGGIAGLAVAVKLYWHKFLSLAGLSSSAREGGRSKPNAEIDERSGS